MDIVKVGRFIAQKRKELNLTQKDLGDRLNITDKAVSKWERGVSCPELDLLGELANILKCNVNELINGETAEKGDSSNRVLYDDSMREPMEEYSKDVTVELDYTSSASVSPLLFGTNIEHTRNCVHRGLSAQMLENRKFTGKPQHRTGVATEWYGIGERVYFMVYEHDPYTRHGEGYHMKRILECNSQQITKLYEGPDVGIGQHGLYLQKGMGYECRVVIKTMQPVTLTVSLTNADRSVVYAKETQTIDCREYETFHFHLTSNVEDPNADITFTYPEMGCVLIGALSLLPDNHWKGMRRDVVECLKEMGIKMLRWPGGNYAGEYNWKDGLLPVDMRAPNEAYLHWETQPHSGGYDFHEINTDDFIALCREIGAEAYITLNPTWCTPQESAQWVEYCNGDETTEYGKLRIERGFKEPYNVTFWSLGNEAGFWHMEGDSTPYGYYKNVREHAKEMLKVSPNLSLCTSGAFPAVEWVNCVAKPLSDLISYVQLHIYFHAPNHLSAERDREEYQSFFGEIDRTEIRHIKGVREALGDCNLKISYDEWNSWYAWYRPENVRDGVFTAAMLQMFMRVSEPYGVGISCNFEAINEGYIRVDPTSARLTPSGKMYAVLKQHMNGILRCAKKDVIATENDGILTISLVNRSYDKSKKFTLPCAGEIVGATLYHNDCMLPHTQFEEDAMAVPTVNGVYEVVLPKHSVALIQIKLDQ